MKFSIDFDIKFNITNDAVVCIATPVDINDIFAWDCQSWTGVGFRPRLAKGIARLKDGDTNDIETAKKVARKKALRKFYKEYKNSLTMTYRAMERKLGQFSDHIVDVQNRAQKIEEEIIEMTRD